MVRAYRAMIKRVVSNGMATMKKKEDKINNMKKDGKPLFKRKGKTISTIIKSLPLRKFDQSRNIII